MTISANEKGIIAALRFFLETNPNKLEETFNSFEPQTKIPYLKKLGATLKNETALNQMLAFIPSLECSDYQKVEILEHVIENPSMQENNLLLLIECISTIASRKTNTTIMTRIKTDTILEQIITNPSTTTNVIEKIYPFHISLNYLFHPNTNPSIIEEVYENNKNRMMYEDFKKMIQNPATPLNVLEKCEKESLLSYILQRTDIKPLLVNWLVEEGMKEEELTPLPLEWLKALYTSGGGMK